MGKLIFLDIDGTLVPAGTNAPPKSAERAIRLAQERGHRVFLCSGRNLGMLRPLLRYRFDGYVASSGGYVVLGEELLYDHPMSDEQLRTALDIFHKNGVVCTIEGRDGSFCDSDLKSLLSESEEGNSELLRWKKAVSENLGIRPMEEYDGQPIYKIVLAARSIGQIEACRPPLERDFNFMIQDIPEYGCVNGEMVDRAFDKGKGIIRIAERLGSELSDTIGFGDSRNDLEMMEVCGFSVCMGNGSEQLKKFADYVCPPVTEDGLAEAFRRLGLTES